MTIMSQRALIAMTLLSLAISVGLSLSAEAGNQGTSQQDKVKTCNNIADNRSLKGEDRKKFMQDCLNKAGTPPLSEMSQRDKLNACKSLADRRNLKGEDRRSFLKDCMNKANPK
jgi:psiF repeat